MKRILRQLIRCLFFSLFTLILSGNSVLAQTEKLFLGVRLRPETQAVADEIERKTNRKIYAEFVEFADGESTLGTSYFSERGTPVIRINMEFRDQPQKIEAIAAHELLHMRLRANGYPVFLFSPSVKTRRGLAQDFEQTNVNDLASMIEHRIFKKEMEKFGINGVLNLAGASERTAQQRKGSEGGQVEALNFARAVLEYQNSADVEKLRKIYIDNKWQTSLKIGQEIADIINRTPIDSPATSARVFQLCAAKLYSSSRPFRLTFDKTVTAYRQMIIGF
jgi:hypothetical protein